MALAYINKTDMTSDKWNIKQQILSGETSPLPKEEKIIYQWMISFLSFATEGLLGLVCLFCILLFLRTGINCSPPAF